jgi:hypothetical protein
LARRKAQLVCVLPAQRPIRAVDEIDGIDALGLRVAVEAERGGGHPSQVVAVEVVAGAE